MSARTLNGMGGASASPIAKFPPPKYPHRANRIASMGRHAIKRARERGESIGSNVVLIEPEAKPEPVDRSVELALIVSVFLSLPKRQQEKVRQGLRDATEALPADRHIRSALALLDGRR